MSGIVLNNTPKKIDKGRDRILNNSPKKIITEKDQIYLTAIWSFLLSYIQWMLPVMGL